MRVLRRVLRALFVTTLAILALLLLAGLLLRPPRAAEAVDSGWVSPSPVARGAFHIHSVVSDGTGTIDEIAAAAARAGLHFIVMTDHGDATRAPMPPAYRSGVLCLDGVEISTQFGHYAATGLAQSPYPLAGHPDDVIEDVRRLGGFGVIAHPGSPKQDLRWRAWDADTDGLEWLNADSEWRDEAWGPIGRGLLTYAFRPVETLAALLDRPAEVLQHWDRLTRHRRVPALAGADAHARLAYREDTYASGHIEIARFPSYEVSFKAFVNHAVLDRPLSGDASADATLVLSALREGRIFTTIDGLAKPGGFEMTASSGAHRARVGEYLDVDGTATIDARIAAPAGTAVALLRDGAVVTQSTSSRLTHDVTTPGAYRIEAYLPGASGTPPVPWLVSNPIYIGLRSAHEGEAAARRSLPPAKEQLPLAVAGSGTETSEGSQMGVSGSEWRFAIAGGVARGHYAAITFPVAGKLASYERVRLEARADRPMRLWVQIRAATPGGAERWGRTFYLDGTLRTIDLRLDQFRPIGPVFSSSPPIARADTLLIAADTLNFSPGGSGTVDFSSVVLVK